MLVAKVKAQVTGDGLDDQTGGGPVVSKVSICSISTLYKT